MSTSERTDEIGPGVDRVPEGYVRMPPGVRCRCIAMKIIGDDAYCCNPSGRRTDVVADSNIARAAAALAASRGIVIAPALTDRAAALINALAYVPPDFRLDGA